MPVLVLLLLMAFAGVAVAAPGGQVMIDVPDSVGIGQPFMVRLASSRVLDDLEIAWGGRIISPASMEVDGGHRATVLLGVGLKSEPGAVPFVIRSRAAHGAALFSKSIAIVEHGYQSEALSVDPDMITPPDSVRERIKRERDLMLEALRTESPERMWRAPFMLPVKGKKLSRFGLHRVFNGESKRRHKGLDFRAWLGTPIHCIAPGKVVLVGDFYFGGNCVVINHGNGVVSMSAHLSQVRVREGDLVEGGQEIGLSGATGRATGAHLHLSVVVHGVSVDPEPLFAMDEEGAFENATAFAYTGDLTAMNMKEENHVRTR